jgi:ABC-type glutathione transport system ATPase component
VSALLEVEGLRVRLPTRQGPVTVVDGVDYEVQPAEVFGVAGESGSGKTMSVLALLGLLPPAARPTATRASAAATCSASAAPSSAPSAGATSGSSSRTR